jgi:WD40 repeat protein
LERNFLNASLDARERERLGLRRTNRRLRRQLVGALVALAVAAVATVVAVSQLRTADRQRRAAQLSLLASSAKDLASSQVDVAGLLATEANRLRPDGESLDALESVLRTRPDVARSIYPSFLSDGSRLLDVSADGRVALFYDGATLTTMDTATLASSSTVPLDDVRAAGLSPSGDRVAVATSDQLATYRSDDGATLTSLPSGGPASFIDSELLWLDESRVLVSPPNGIQFRSIDVDNGGVTPLDALASQHIEGITGSSRRMVPALDLEHQLLALVPALGDNLFDGTNTTPVYTAPLPALDNLTKVTDLPGGGATNVQFSRDGEWLGVGTQTGVQLLHATNGEFQLSTMPPQRKVLTRATLNPDGTQLATLDATGEFVLYAVSPAGGVEEVTRATVAGATGAFFGPDDGQVYLTAGNHLVVVATDGSEPLATAPFGDADEAPFAIAPSGTMLFTVNSKGFFRRYDPTTGEAVAYQSDGTNVPQFFSADGSVLIGYDVSARRYDVLSDDGHVVEQAPISMRDSATSNVSDRAVSLVSEMTADGARVVFFSVPSMTTVGDLTFPPVQDAAMVVSDDGRSLVRFGRSGEDSVFEVRDRATGELRRASIVLPRDSPKVTVFAMSPSDRQIVYGDITGGLSTIDINSGDIHEHVFAASPGPLALLSFTADGTRLFGATRAGDVQWWDVRSHRMVGDEIAAFAGATDVIGSGQDAAYPAYDQLLRFIAVPTEEGIRQWNFDVTTWPTIACRRAGRNLTKAEWAQYLPAGEPYHVTCPEYPSG